MHGDPGGPLHPLLAFLRGPVLVSFLLLAGCLASTPAVKPPTPGELLDRLDWTALGTLLYNETHDHTDRQIHVEVTRGLEVLAQTTLSEDGRSLGEYTEADVGHGMIAVAVTIGIEATVRVVLLDANALPAVKILGAFEEPQAYGDVKFDPLRPLVYVAYPLPTVPNGKAFSIWDVADPAHPKRMGEVPGVGCHMLHTMAIGPTSYVWCSAIDGAQPYEVVADPAGGWTAVPLGPAEPQSDPEVLRYTTYYAALGGTPRTWVTRVHDMTSQVDPFTGRPVLVTAHELQGVRIFDASQPEAPREIGAWRGQGLDGPMDRIHTVGLFKVGDRRVAFAATETFNKVPPSLYVIDFTDYAAPKLLAHWVPPGIRNDQGLVYSMHNFQVVGTRLYVCNFHAGLWVLDISDPAKPTPIALRTPVWDAQYPWPGRMDFPGFRMDENMFWDVVAVRGYLVATDMSAGIEVLHVHGDPAGDPAWTGIL